MTTVRVGSVSIPIYTLKDGRFMPVWVEGGHKKRRPYKALAKAKRIAEAAAIRIANGAAAAADVKAAVEKTIERVVVQTGITRRKIPELVEQLITEKRDHKLSPRYMRGLSGDLQKRFAKHFPFYIDEVKALDISKYLRELGVSDRRRNNVRDEIVTLFLFAKEHHALPQDRITEAEKVKRIALELGAPRIYTPEQFRIIHEHVRPEWEDWMFVQAFAGIRPEEAALPHKSKRTGAVRKLMWSDFLWDDRQIYIDPLISKTGRHRYAEINDTLMSWCGHHRGETGPVCVLDRPDRETERLGKLLGFDWINDGLRHAYASYWNSLHRDMAKLKELMGNSEQTNRRYYFNAQPESIARAWFGYLAHVSHGSKVVQIQLELAVA